MDVELLSKLCGLLGSAHAGERAAAAEKATAMLRTAGLTWAEIIAAAQPGLGTGEEAPRHVDWREQVAIMLAHPWFWRLTDWDRKFLRDVSAWNGGLSARQAAQINRIIDRFGRWAERGTA